jgi:hypothetical protein
MPWQEQNFPPHQKDFRLKTGFATEIIEIFSKL